MESLEPRLLLSADTVLAGSQTALLEGLTATADEIGGLIDTNTLFSSFVPGVLVVRGSGDNAVEISPTLRDALNIPVDVNSDVGDDFPGLYSGGDDDLAAIFNYVLDPDVPGFPGFTPYDAEAALRAMDINNDSLVSIEEAFKVLVVGQISAYINSATIIDGPDSGTGVGVGDLAFQVAAFMNSASFNQPDSIVSYIDLDLNGAATGAFDSDTGTLLWSMPDLSLQMVTEERFDLGYEANELSIALDPAKPLTDPGVPTTPTKVQLVRTLQFDSFFFGLRDADDAPVASADFFFAAPGTDNLKIGVAFANPGGANDLDGADINIGFLGATVTAGTASLDMHTFGKATDPSNPDALGFSLAQQGTPQASGTLLAAATPVFADLDLTDIEFTLRVGTGVFALPVAIKLDNSASNDDATAIATSLNSAIGLSSSALGDIVTATNDGGKIRLTLVPSNVVPLGFANQQGGGFGQTILTAANVSSLVGQVAAGQQVSFMLGRGGQVPKRITVTGILNDPDGPDGLTGTAVTDADNNTISAATLAAALTTALSGFGGDVTVNVVGAGVARKLELNGTGAVLEITHTLTLDTIEQITIEELGLGQIFEVAADPNASFDVALSITAKSGLENFGAATAYAPVGTIKADINPLGDGPDAGSDPDVTAVTIDDGVKHATFALTDTTGVLLKSTNSDMRKMLDFNVIGAADILGIINQLANFAERLGGTDLLQAFDLPFGDSPLADLLNFKDLIQDTLLIDDKDDGPTKSGADEDVDRLLEWVGDSGKEKLIARFGTAQELETRLADVLVELGVFGSTADALAAIDASVKTYDVNKQDLIYNIKITDNIMPKDVAIQVPLDFDLNLGPFANFETTGKIEVEANGEFGFTVGIKLGNAVAALDIVDTDPLTGTNLLSDLNSGAGVTVNDNPALTSLATIDPGTGRLITIDPIIGRLSANATFTLTTFSGAGNTQNTYSVIVSKSATDNNRTVADLVGDINDALVTAGVGATVLTLKVKAESAPLIGDAGSAKIVLRAMDSTINTFQVSALSNNAAYTELGFGPKRAATVSLVAPVSVAAANPTDSTPASPGVVVAFSIDVTSDTGVLTTVNVSLPTGVPPGELHGTGDNISLDSLIADINAQLDTNVLVASQTAGFIAISAVSDNVRFFKLTPGANADKIGFGSSPLFAGVVLGGGATPLDPFGRLGINVVFKINGNQLTVTTAATAAHGTFAANASIDDLIIDINAAIAAIPGNPLGGKVEAFNFGSRVAFRAIDPSIGQIDVTELSDDERVALGFANSSTGASATRPDLILTSSLAAPVSYGVGENTSFTIKLNGELTGVTANLLATNTILNRSLFDLVASINGAMNTAFGGQANNPLIATVQAGQIVIGVRTAPTGANLIGDPYEPFPDVTNFTISALGNSAAAKDLKLVLFTNTAVEQTRGSSGYDFLIFFADNTSVGITLEAIAGVTVGPNSKLSGSLASLVAGIELQSLGKLDITIGSDGTTLRLHDISGGTGNEFRVVAANGSPAALQLGILGKDTSNLNVNENPAGALIRDGFIDGARIATVDLLERAYLTDAALKADLTVKTPGALSAEATFGFVGVTVSTAGAQTLFKANLEIPFLNDDVTLDTLFGALDDKNIEILLTEVGVPALTIGTTPSFDLNVALVADPSGDMPTLSLGAGKVKVTLPASLGTMGIVLVDDDANAATADVPDLQMTAFPIPTVDFSGVGYGLGDLANFDSINFDSVIAALKAISGFLNQFSTFSFLGDEIPGLGLSVNDLLGVADRFAHAVEDIENNPSGGLQALGQKVREAFGLPNLSAPADLTAFFANLGIPDPTKLIQFALDNTGGHLLRFDLRLPVGFSKGLSLDLDLGSVGFLGGSSFVDLQGGAGISATGFLDARLSFAVDLDNPANVYVYDDLTGVFGHLGAHANNVAFNAAIGPMGVFIKDGKVDLNLDFNLSNGDTTPDGSRVLVGDFVQSVIDGVLNPTLLGTAKATLPVYFPSDSEYLGDIGLDISGANSFSLDGSNGLQLPDFGAPGVLTLPNFSNIDLSTLNPFASIPLMLDTLDFFLQGLQDVMSGEIFGLELPFIGDQLQSGADFIENLREDILGPIRQYVEQAPELGQELVQALLFELLAAPSAQGMVGGVNVESIIGIGSDIQGVGLLKDYLTGSIVPATIAQEDIVLQSLGLTDYLWKFRLGQSFKPPVAVDFDLGIPALSLDADIVLDITLDWDLATGIGVSTAQGAYIFLGNQRTPSATDDDELQLTLDVKVVDGSNITGNIGFLQLNITEDGVTGPAIAAGLEQTSPGTFLHGAFSVNLSDSSADPTQEETDRMSFAELGSIDADVHIEADAEVNLKIDARFNPAVVPDAISALLPEVHARFVLDWETGEITSDTFDFATSLQVLGFRDVTVDMGSFISKFLGPFLGKISEVTDPLQPIIDVITAPIPVLSDLAGQPITLIDIAGMTGYVEPAMIYAIADIISLVNKIGDASAYGEFLVPLGNFMIIDSAGSASLLTGPQLLKPGFSLSSTAEQDPTNPFTKDKLGDFLSSTGQSLASFDSLLSGAPTGGTQDADSKNLVTSLKSGNEAASSGFAFPLFDDPSLIFGLFLGQDIPLVTYDLAPFGMEFTYVQKFPIWGPLFARITGSMGLTIDLAFGYDTAGVRQFAEGDFSNPLDLLGGLYISDTDQVTGEGTDVPELILKGEIFAGAELNLGVASAGAEGGIILTVNFDLNDPDGDGKVRVDELLGNFLYELNYGSPALAPLAIFDVFGDVSAQLRAFIEALFFKKTFDITPPIVLVEFEVPFEREPFLATERKDGSLVLNVGPNSAQRLNGDTRDADEKVYVRSVSDTEVLVWNGTTVRESDAQSYKIGAANLIVGFGGSGNDLIDLSQVTHNIRYELEGNEGDDTLLGTQAGGKMTGGLGNDVLTGGDSIDLIIGSEGNDTIDGNDAAHAAQASVNTGDDADIIFGDTGVFTPAKPPSGPNPATPNRYRSFVGEKDGDDTIYGRGGNDFIFGGGGIDLIFGNEGADVILGDGGNFELPSGNALPLLNGDIDLTKFNSRGAGALDFIYGNAGNDLLLGGAGNDFVDGGADVDTIDGGVGFDTLYGGSAGDIIYGGDNDDIIFGFRDPVALPAPMDGDGTDGGVDGRDRIYGQEGNDFIRGNGDNDTIEGNRGADIIFGDAGNDIITGELGGDIIFGGADNDTIDAGDGGDIVFGDEGLVVYFNFYGPAITPFTTTGSRIRTDITGVHQLIGDGNETVLIPLGYTPDGLETSQDLIVTAPVLSDGSDYISGGDGDDIVFGGGSVGPGSGAEFDTIFGDYDPALGFQGPRPTGQDILIGDGGRIELTGRRVKLAAAVSNALDGKDHITGNDSGDYIFGGGFQDLVFGFADAAAFPGGTSALNRAPLAGLLDNDVILGDNGEIHLNPSEVANRIIFITTTFVVGDSGASDTIDGDFDNDIVLGGLNSSSDIINGDVGQDILIGDQGAIYFDDDPGTLLEVEGDGNLDTLDLVRSFRDGLGGIDVISGDAGSDVLIGGTAGDEMYGDNFTASSGNADGEDIMLGDNADIYLIGLLGRLLVQVAAMPAPTAVDLITTTDAIDAAHPNRAAAESAGGPDMMSGNAKADIIIGGVNNDDGVGPAEKDTLYGDRAVPSNAFDLDDIMLGDNGLLDFTYLADSNRNTLDLIRSREDGLGGKDVISGDRGSDVAIGGTDGDEIYGDDSLAHNAANDGADMLLGDNADIFLVAKGLASGGDLKLVLDAAVKTIRTTDEEHPEYGGIDIISGNAKGDIIAGGVAGDFLYGDRALPILTTSTNDGNDVILGDNGAFEWLSTGRLSEIHGINIAENNPGLFAKFNPGIADTDLTTLDLITTEQPTSGGRDTIHGDEKNDVVFGGTDLDIIYGDDSDEFVEVVGALNRDVLFGDHGRLYPHYSTLGDFNSRNFFAIDTGNGDGGEGDKMWGEEGDDVMLGQQGDDRMWGGSGNDDMIGGHNVSGGYDELTAPAIVAIMNPPMNDLMDGGSGNDAMTGDNAIVWRRGDDTNPRFRLLVAGLPIYTTTADGVDPAITANVGSIFQSDPDDAVGRDIEIIDHSDAVEANPQGRFGADVMAGGADNDVMFGDLGNDLMQGDGSISETAALPPSIVRTLTVTDSGNTPDTDQTLYFNIPEALSDGDDYMEGSGGSDLMYGGLGQDDIIGGSSGLFGLTTEDERPDGSDIIFGGAGTPARLVRNDFVGSTDTDHGTAEGVGAVPTGNDPSIAIADRHSRDADFIMGDNANVFRLVALADNFLQFNFDQTSAFEDRGTHRIVPRAMQQLDYTLGGADYHGGVYENGAAHLAGQPADNGAGDLIHGESGDDYIFGMTGSDVIYGESDDDDIIGGYGNDWISGGTGSDGVLGDDGLLYTSRNSTVGEPLYGIAGFLAVDTTDKYSNGNALNEVITTPGDIQYAVINVTGRLKKTVDIVPFSYDPDWIGTDDEFANDASNVPFADDLIFGGLNSDWLHGGSGDDAISGAEALEHAYVPVAFDADGFPHAILDLGYNSFDDLTPPINPGDVLASPNPGDVLAFNPEDLDGRHLNNRFRAGEFFLYDEYEPLRKILLDSLGNLWKSALQGVAFEYILNFDETEGVFRPGGTVPKATGQQTETFGVVQDDGTDAIFGDMSNDWLVGGTGRDDMFGGWGNDLLNADDNQDTHGDLNDQPDTHPTYEDRAYGGAGRDVLIANTGGDRLIDWVGEYNSYLVPYAPFGEASVSRTMQPYLPEFLYALSSGDGADPTRFHDAIGGIPPAPTNNNPNPSRNGEPHGELGLVLQKDFAWGDQTGAPADPQAGNIPGGPRDVLRTANFNDGTASAFFADSGTWTVAQGSYQVAPVALGGDASSVFYVNQYIPRYFEMLATLNAVKPTGGFKSNAYVIFDYQSETDFKFAGINVSTNKLEIGHRTESGWIIDRQGAVQSSLRSDTNYNVFLSFNGSVVTMIVDNVYTLTFTFAPRVDFFGLAHGLNDGMVGLGANNSKAKIDNVSVQRLSPQYTYIKTVDFSNGTTSLLLAPESGSWPAVSNGRYSGTASGSTPAIDLINLVVAPSAVTELSAQFSVTAEGGFVFDHYDAARFKFVTISAGKITLGHHTAKGWFVDATYTNATLLKTGVDLTLGLVLKGTTVSVTINGQLALSYVYNALVGDGDFGLLSRTGTTSFDTLTVKSDDAGLLNPGSALMASESGPTNDGSLNLTEAQIAAVAGAALKQWTASTGAGTNLDALKGLSFQLVNDLPGNAVAWSIGDGTILIDISAAGNGWFVDTTPYSSREFSTVDGILTANFNTAAAGRMDLLTVIEHEMGHVLGFEHGMDDLMGATLATGIRKLESPADSRQLIDWDSEFKGIGFKWNRQAGAGFPEFAIVDKNESSTSGQKKKRLYDEDSEPSIEPELSDLDWYVEL